MVAPPQCELGLWGLLTLLSLGEAQARSAGHAAGLSRPHAACSAASSPEPGRLRCSSAAAPLPAGAPDEDSRRPEGRRDLHLPSTRCPSSSPAPPSNSAVEDKPSPGGPAAWLLSELPASASSHPFGAPGSHSSLPSDPPGLSSPPAGLPAAASHSHCRCVTCVPLLASWLFSGCLTNSLHLKSLGSLN